MSIDLATKDKLNLETAVIAWKKLQVFFAQGKLLIVKPSNDLVHVAATVANNSVSELELLINDHQVEFATPDWIKAHCTDNTEMWAVVVSPYVIAQLKQE